MKTRLQCNYSFLGDMLISLITPNKKLSMVYQPSSRGRCSTISA